MTSWLVDTLLYTGILIALVLLLRRAVAREFGPKFAYALWALPVLRLLLPPVVLPVNMAPAEPEANAEAAFALAVAADRSPLASPAPEAVFQPADLLLPLWLGGAVLFLVWRIATYLRMRRELLAGAWPVGEVGPIRIVETPAVGSPVAFGVFDKVIALPPRFMAMEDRMARDLAIAHELEHHRGLDLAANFAAQPLLALHWFNPLAWLGWRAMRRDQEAACDARVLETRGHEVRAAYAGVIASFAAGPRLALAAPMACPVLGEKSIIHRLRSLSMSEVSPGRRLLGRLLLASGAIALPLTASVSYAAAESQALEQVKLPPSAAAPPPPPAPPAAPEAPQAPAAPDAPALASDAEQVRVVRVARAGKGTEGPDGAPAVRQFQLRHEELSAEQRARLEDMRRNLEERRIELAGKTGELRAHALAMADVHRSMPVVVERCDTDQGVRETVLPDGRRQITICHRAIERQAQSSALMGLRAARNTIAHNSAMSDAVRREVLDDLDEEITRIEAER